MNRAALVSGGRRPPLTMVEVSLFLVFLSLMAVGSLTALDGVPSWFKGLVCLLTGGILLIAFLLTVVVRRLTELIDRT